MSGLFRFRINVNSPAVAGFAAVFAVAALASCESPPKSVAANEPAKVDPEAKAKPGPASDLALLAERDVEAFLSRRHEAQSDVAEASPSQEILWNQPFRRRPPATPTLPQPTLDEAAKLSEQILAAQAQPLKPVEDSAEDEADSEDRSALDPNHLRELLVDLSKELYHEASYADMPMRELLLIAATTLVSPDRALVPEAIPGLTDRERELLGHFQSFFVELGRRLDGSRNADDVLLSEIEALRASLSTEPRLELGALALCTRVGGFGDYTTFERNAFLAHEEHRAIVYIEIVGFRSETNSKGEWVTELAQQLIIYSERDGIPVWREDWQSAVDVSRNRRNDFFVVQIITLPKALSVGKYHLKVRVRDEKSRAEAERSIPFEMVADPRMAPGG